MPTRNEPWRGLPLEGERALLAARWLRERPPMARPGGHRVEPRLIVGGSLPADVRLRVARAGMQRAKRSGATFRPERRSRIPRLASTAVRELGLGLRSRGAELVPTIGAAVPALRRSSRSVASAL